MHDQVFDLAIIDYRMDDMDGLEVLDVLKVRSPDTEALLLTGYGSIEIADDAMKKGAADFIEKTNLREALPIKIEKVLDYRDARRYRERLDEENQYLRDEISGRYNFGEIVGTSEQMAQILATGK